MTPEIVPIIAVIVLLDHPPMRYIVTIVINIDMIIADKIGETPL